MQNQMLVNGGGKMGDISVNFFKMYNRSKWKITWEMMVIKHYN